jgi:hypothetical protein
VHEAHRAALPIIDEQSNTGLTIWTHGPNSIQALMGRDLLTEAIESCHVRLVPFVFLSGQRAG